MSALAYFEFVATLVVAAVLWALIGGATDDIRAEASTRADSSAASTGVEWLAEWTQWLPLWVVLLAAFGLIVAVVVRRTEVLG